MVRIQSACRHIPAFLVALVVLAGCGAKTGPEQQLRNWVAAAESAVEEKDRGAFMDLVSPAYADARGQQRDDIDKILRYWFLRQNRIALLVAIDDIAITSDTFATISLTAGMAGTSDKLLEFDADAWRFEIDLEATGQGGSYKDWQLIAARYGELGRSIR